MQKWPTAREKYTTYHRGRSFDLQTLESNWASPMEDEIMSGKLLPQTQNWIAQTIVTQATIVWPRTRPPAWRGTPGLPIQAALREAGGNKRTSGPGSAWYWRRHWARWDRGEQHVVDNNVSSSAVISYISTANKVGGNQWEFHVITLGNISPCWGTKKELIYSLVTTVYVLFAASNEIPSKKMDLKSHYRNFNSKQPRKGLLAALNL
jgi:hypothetical protein